MRTPEAPAPVNARPTMNIVKLLDKDVTVEPRHMNMVEENMHKRGLNTCDSRPINGASEDMAMRYEEVNQLACSKASRSSAIDDCVVVRMEMFVADTVSC